ncbi:hypothetical protein TWF730_008099 [Orbilia blumenaviensis]|uniref:Uncharacterized protein n=1 Tax=Orbilia blumenaviensis TaxID=1796055 RepID=A0AAV9VGA9_9PEZI
MDDNPKKGESPSSQSDKKPKDTKISSSSSKDGKASHKPPRSGFFQNVGSTSREDSPETLEAAHQLTMLSRESEPDGPPSNAYTAPIGSGRSVEKKKVTFKTGVEGGGLPLHPSVFRPFNPADHPTLINDFDTLEKRLLRVGLTCTFPPDSYCRPNGNPEWSLKSILQSRYMENINARRVEYEAQFVSSTGRVVATQWFLFDDLNWPWGVRIMRNFHERNLCKPMDPRLKDPAVLKTEWNGPRSDWFNGKDIYMEETISKDIYFQTKHEQVERYKKTVAAKKTPKSDPPPYSAAYIPPSWKPRVLRLRPPKPEPPPELSPDTTSSDEAENEDIEMTEAMTGSEESYSEGSDPDMQVTFQKALHYFKVEKAKEEGKRKGKDKKAGSNSEPEEIDDDFEDYYLSPDPVDVEAIGSKVDQKTEEEKSAEKSLWIQKMKRASQNLIRKKPRLGSPRKGADKKKDDKDEKKDDKDENKDGKFEKKDDKNKKKDDKDMKEEDEENWEPPATINDLRPPVVYGRWVLSMPLEGDFLPPMVLPHRTSVGETERDTSESRTSTRYEKPLVKKKSFKSRKDVGGKERNPGMASDDEKETTPGTAAMDNLSINQEASGESSPETKSSGSAVKRSRASAGSLRGDSKRTRQFDEDEEMGGVEESSIHGELAEDEEMKEVENDSKKASKEKGLGGSGDMRKGG